ncbi:MAG: hypothetical protein ACKVOQ_14245 [Cyclobacteriaceae bacterium]
MEKAETSIEFQYQKKGDIRPSSTHLPDVATPLDSSAMIPNVGDLVTILTGHPRSEAKFITYKVIARNYLYTYVSLESSVIGKCEIYIIVTDTDKGEVGINFRQ